MLTRRSATRGFAPARQRGVVLLYSLIALTILLISGLALVRGMGTSLGIGGDLALRRDMINQGELGVSTAKALFATGALNTATLRASSATGANYSATTLASESSGIPIALLDDATFAGVGSSANDISGAGNLTVRYVIDRQCSAAGAPTASNCVTFQKACAPGQPGCSGNVQGATGAGRISQTVYRITVRVTGPKNAVTFLQTTISS